MNAKQVGVLAETGIPLLIGVCFLLIGLGVIPLKMRSENNAKKSANTKTLFLCSHRLIDHYALRLVAGMTSA
ncbi:MAG: hypothetical protein QM775_05550 [Pirellulales bacterium]